MVQKEVFDFTVVAYASSHHSIHPVSGYENSLQLKLQLDINKPLEEHA